MITDDEFLRISVYMKQNYGIDLSQKKVIINGRLENYLRKGGFHTCTDYLDALKKDRKDSCKSFDDESYIFYAGI